MISIDKSHILIDAGVYDTYHNFIKQRLTVLAQNSGKLDLMVVTHVDQDHIQGAIELISENGISGSPLIIPIEQVWHNSYRHLQFSKAKHIGESEIEILRDIISNGKKHTEQRTNESEDISAKQGSTLAGLLLSRGYSWNKSFQGKAVNSDKSEPISFSNFTVTLLSPNTKKLEKLAEKWEKELLKKKYNFVFSAEEIFDDAFEFGLLTDSNEGGEDLQKPISKVSIQFKDLLSVDETTDKSATNGSSIAFILEAGNKKMLFLGDAHPDIVFEQLDNMEKDHNGRIVFDLVKISHHGSSNNTNTRILELIDCSKYVISTDGSKHGHPDLSTLAKIIQESKGEKIEIYCNYRTANSQFIEELVESLSYKCTIVYPDDSSVLRIEV
ncbi:hypothetical protein JCM16418A_41850 [Paenibacillus pini]